MKTNTPRIAIRVFTLAALVVLASSPSTRTIAGSKLIKPASSAEATQARLAASYGKLPLSFEANRGQTDRRVKFLSRGSGYTLFLTGDEAVLSLRSQKSGVRSQKSGGRPSSLVPRHSQRTRGSAQGTKDKGPGTNDVLRMKLVGANQAANVTALDELSGKTNYFIGSDPKKWRTDVPTYGKVKYEGVYPGIDLVYYGNQRQLEYDFVVAPGADPKAITLAIENRNTKIAARQSKIQNRKSKIDSNGDLVVEVNGSEVRFHKPVVYQPTADAANPRSEIQNRKLLDGRYVLTTDNQIHFEISNHDKTRPLVIDPVLVYSTYLGGGSGTNGDVGNVADGIAVDSGGNAYVTGQTCATDFPTTSGAFEPSNPGAATFVTCTAFVTKLNPKGSALVYSTYLGGSTGGGFATAIAADAAGNAYVTGLTVATDFPVVNAFQPTYAGDTCSDDCGNVFVTKIDAAGNALVYSTYLGGASNGSTRSQGSGIVVDSTGSAYVTGSTSTPDFPTTANALQPTYPGGGEAFVTKFNATGNALAYSTFLGTGNGTETDGQGIAVDSTGNAYVAGSTNSTSFPATAGAFQTACGGGPTTVGDCNLDAFLIKLKADGSSLIYSTYLGGAGNDQAYGVAVDSSGSAYVTGATRSNDFPTLNALQTQVGNTNAFVTKFAPDGSSLIYSTYLGGIGGESRDGGSAIALDSAGNAYIAGQASAHFPTANAIQSQLGSVNTGSNAFVACLAPNGGALIYSTYLGGSGYDTGNGIAVDSAGNAYVAGSTSSVDFPTVNGFQPASPSLYSAFVAKISPANAPAASLHPGSLSFGNQFVHTTGASQTITLSDMGTAPLSISQISITGANSGDFAQTNNCGTSLTGAGSCTITVTFTPAATGPRSAAITVTDNAAGSPHTASLSGTGTIEPVASYSPTYLDFDYPEAGITSAPQTVTLQNTGNAAMAISSIAVSSPFGQTNNCGSSLAVGASCAINVTFTAPAAGIFFGTLTFADNAPNSPQAVNLRGAANSGPATLAPSSLTFGNQMVGTRSGSQSATLTNTGTAPMSVSSIGLFGHNSGDFAETNNCPIQPSTLAVNASCTIHVTFAPTASGTRTGTLEVFDDASTGFGGQTVSLTGTGMPPGGLAPAVVQVQNNIDVSGAAFTSFSVSIKTSPGDLLVAFVRESSNCEDGFRVTDSAGQSWSLLTSECESNTGPTIRMFYIVNSGAVASVTVNYGTPGGVIKPGIMVMEIAGAGGLDSGPSLEAYIANNSKASVTTSTSRSLSTSNPNDILIFATDTASNQTTGWGAGNGYTIPNNKLAVGASGSNIRMAMQYSFVSAAQTSTTASMTYSNAAWNGNIFAAFKLVAASAPVVTWTPSSLNFRNQPAGTTSPPQSVTLSNAGTAILAISNIGVAPPFSQSSNCGASLPPGSSCTITVTFTPSAAGTESSGNVVVQDNAGAQAIGVSGNGIAVGSGGVAFVQVQNNLDTNASNLHTSFSLPITTNPGDLLVAFCRESSNGTDNFTVTDSAGQSWTVVYFNNESGTGPRIGMFYMANSAAVTSVTVRYITSGGVIRPGIMVMELSPASGSPALDGATNGGATSTTISTSGSLTTFNANDILIFATDTAANQVPNANTSGGWMAGPGYAIPSNNLVIGASGSNQRMAMQFKIVSSTQSALKTSMTYANSAWNGNIFAAFK